MAGELKEAWPDFLVIGAAKSATTSLYHYLKQHPEIYMSPVKEPKFFSLVGDALDFQGPGDERIRKDTTTDAAAYHRLFADAPAGQIWGEASTVYLNDPSAAQRILEAIPEVRLLAMLRHPAERAFSAYMHLVRDGWETLDFESALKAELRRQEQNYYFCWHYQERGFYARGLSHYYKRFPRQNIRVFLYDEFEAQPHQVLSEMFDFLGVDRQFRCDVSARHNRSGVPRSAGLSKTLIGAHPLKKVLKRFIPEGLGHRVVSGLQAANMSRPELSPELRRRLTDLYRDDILELQRLLERDLSHWLKE